MKSYAPSFILVINLLLVAVASPLMSQAQQISFTYVFPGPDAERISPFTSLIFREGRRFDLNQIDPNVFSIVGSRSGKHTGTIALSTDHKTIIFYPDQPFAYDESVRIEVLSGLTTADGQAIGPSLHQFHTLRMPVTEFLEQESLSSVWSEEYYKPLNNLNFENRSASVLSGPPYYSRPDLSNTMPVTVTVPANGTADGFIFLTNVGFLTNSIRGLLILDDSGEPIYLKDSTPARFVANFNVQIVNGSPYLTYFEGAASADGTYYVMDDTYTIVDIWEMQNGYNTDLHELLLLDNGNALMLAYAPVPMDLSPYGGPVDGVVVEVVIQELDSAKNVIFEWHSLDHIPLIDTYQELDNSFVDYLHTNAIEVDSDGNILLSNRNTSDVIKINRNTGEVIWRLGGKSNQFNFLNDEGFSFQHDIRRLANGTITLFDNGNLKQPQYSRAVEYVLDETTKSIIRVWQYPDSKDVYTPIVGNAQRLDNGNTMISWGTASKLGEVKSNGLTALEIQLEGVSYRAFRQEWDAVPSELPVATVLSMDATSATLYTSWNGATQITGYEIYSGETTDSLSMATTAPRTGFETAVKLTDLDPNTCVFKVRPVHADGEMMPFSNIVYRFDQPQCLELLSNKIYHPISIVH